MKPFACLLLAGALTTASTLAGSPQQPTGKGASNIDAAIKAVADEYVKAVLAGDAKAVAALYTEDAVEMPPNHPSVKGRTAIQQYYEKQLAAGKFASFSLDHMETRAVGDTGYDIGTYRQNVMPQKGQAVDDRGKFIVVVKRTGGAWRVAYAIYNSDQPPPPPGATR